MIVKLKKLVEKLSTKEKKLFGRIFKVREYNSLLKVPSDMEEWVKKTFGSIESVEKQKVIRIDNKITGETSLFNELRSKRPVKRSTSSKKMKKPKNCPFCQPLKLTPEDAFGRIKGKHCITASNIAKYDYFHGLIIFNEHNPYSFEKEKISDYIDVAMKWFKKANKEDKRAVYPYLMWNCLWRSGASINHGHMQTTLTTKEYPKIKILRKKRKKYEKKYSSNYWGDLFRIHKSLGLGINEEKTKVFLYLTPIKNKETIIYSPNGLTEELKYSLSKVLKAYYKIGIRSFNVSFYLPPLETKGEVLVRFLDRGPLSKRTSDMGAMELYATPVIEDDPFKLIKHVKKMF